MQSQSDQEHDPSESPDRWLVSYADFMTLLFDFFAVIYASSEVNLEKAKDFEKSIKKFVIKAGAFGESGDRTDSGQKENTPIDPPIKTYQKDVPKDASKAALQTILFTEFTESELSKKLIDLADEHSGYRMIVDESQIFASQSAKFNPKGLGFIDRLAKVLGKSEAFIRVETSFRQDQMSSRLYPSSWDLTSSRATTIARYLNSVHKIQAKRITSLSFGPQKDQELQEMKLNGLVEIIVTREPL